MMKTLLVVLLFLPVSLFAQQPEEHDPYRQRADSVVAYFLGKYIFQRYVQHKAQQRNSVTPTTFLFQYQFTHPRFAGRSHVITLALDSAARIVSDHGLIRIESPGDSSWVTASEALRICWDQARRIKRRSQRLAWDSTSVSYQAFRETKNFRDIVPGNLVWRVKGEVLFRGDRYRGVFEVNVFTGAVTRRFAIPWD